jgi:8-oxo-dGTP pyrophosphatase MutT (NUDIX family)
MSIFDRMRSVVLVVVEHEGRYLLIREVKFGQTWYLPAGKVEMRESVLDAAVRETQEEAGIDVVPTGLIELQQYVDVLRFIIAARPHGSLVPKNFPDEHSLEARWFLQDEIASLELRDPEVVRHVRNHASRGGYVLPVSADGFAVR